MAQSTDATCHGGLVSPTDGFQTFQLGLPSMPDPANLFPVWASQRQRLLTFDFAHLYSFTPDRYAYVVSNFSYTTKETRLLSRTTVAQTLETGQDWAKLVTKTMAGCDQSYRCTVLHRRTPDILELELGLPTSVLRAACASYFTPEAKETVTLLSEQLGIQDCTLSGVHNVTSLSLAHEYTQTDQCDPQGFSRLEAKCSSAQEVHFIRDCSTAANKATYFCQGGWEEVAEQASGAGPSFPFSQRSSSGFLIAKPMQRDSTSLRRVCLMYTVINETYIWTVGKHGCDRRLASEPGGHRFTTSLAGTCASYVGRIEGSMSLLVLVLMILLEFIKS